MVMALLVQLTENNNEIQSVIFQENIIIIFFLHEGCWKFETNLVFFVLAMHKLILKDAIS